MFIYINSNPTQIYKLDSDTKANIKYQFRMNIQEVVKKWLVSFGIPKIIIGSLVFYLLYEEFILFLIKKPTQSSQSEMTLTPNLNPHIYICKEPAYEEKAFK